MKFGEIREIVDDAIYTLLGNDGFLLENDVNERSISHRLALYLEDYFPEYDVDCEYNRNVEADNERKYIRIIRRKAIELGIKIDENTVEQNIIERLVYPDIIVHLRGRNDHNLLIIEMKKTSSSISQEFDYEKLRRYTSAENENDLSYAFGAFICVGVLSNLRENMVAWFMEGQKIEQHELS